MNPGVPPTDWAVCGLADAPQAADVRAWIAAQHATCRWFPPQKADEAQQALLRRRGLALLFLDDGTLLHAILSGDLRIGADSVAPDTLFIWDPAAGEPRHAPGVTLHRLQSALDDWNAGLRRRRAAAGVTLSMAAVALLTLVLLLAR